MLLLPTIALAVAPMGIQIVDPTGTPVPCVTLSTVHQVFHTSDDNGMIALVEPGLVGQDVWFHVFAQGYGLPPDFFGYSGAAIPIRDGGSYTLVVQPRGVPGACPSNDTATRLLDGGLPAVPMRVEVIDPATGRGVPLARVRASVLGRERTWITDSSGNIALLDPALYGTSLELSVDDWRGYGPSVPSMGSVVEGGHVVLEAPRQHPGERLYRITGADPYRDTELLGLPTPVPSLQGQVVGQDSNLTVEVDGALLWMYGDTLRPSYPLGHFDMAAATVPDPAGAANGLPLDYFVDADGFSRGIADLSDDGPVWVTGPAMVDDGGSPVVAALFGVFSGLTQTARGVGRYDPALERIVPVAALPLEPNVGHQTGLAANDHVYYREGIRFPATLADAADPTRWKVWSPIVGNSVERDGAGEAIWDWRSDLVVPDAARLSATDRWTDVRDPIDGMPVALHEGSVFYSPYRRRYVHVFTRDAGFFSLGELWISEADQPHGPWRYARRFADHDGYTSYNPMPNPGLGPDDQHLYVQATYTISFASETEVTPRYDYNQLMYRLDLEHPELRMPVPVYVDGGNGRTLHGLTGADMDGASVSFHAFDRSTDGAVGIGPNGPSCAPHAWVTGAEESRFWAFEEPSAGLVPLSADGEGVTLGEGAGVLGWVWPHDGAPARLSVEDLPSTRVELGPDRCLTSADSVVLDAASFTVGTTSGTYVWTVDGTSSNGGVISVQPGPVPQWVTLTWTSDRGVPVSDGLWVVGPEETVAVTSPNGTTSTQTTGPDPVEPASGESSNRCGCDTISMGSWLPVLPRRR